MIFTRREILDQLLDYVGHTGDDGARNTAEMILNGALETIWQKRVWRAFIAPTPYLITTVAGTRAYALPGYFGRIMGDRGELRNVTLGTRIRPITKSDMDEQNPEGGTSLETTGRPRTYTISGTQPVSVQPAATGDALEVVSDSAADSTIRVEVSGLTTDGVWDRRQVTLTGLAAVAIGTWCSLDGFAKAYPEGTDPTTELTSSEGTVTVRKVVGGTVLGTLLPQESARDVQVLLFDPTPDGVYSIPVPFVRAVQRSDRDADPMPPNWAPALLEEMHIEWLVQAGDLPRAAAMQLPRAKLIDLVCLENAAEAQWHRFRQPYTG